MIQMKRLFSNLTNSSCTHLAAIILIVTITIQIPIAVVYQYIIASPGSHNRFLLSAESKESFAIFEHVHMQLVKNAEKSMASRNAWLKAQKGAKVLHFKDMALQKPQALALAQPYFHCPWSLERSNFVDEEFDGGKWTCGIPETKDRSCIVYSFGSSGNDIFERHIYNMNPLCEIHVFDPTSTPIERWKFHSYGLCASGDSFSHEGKTYSCKQLPSIMKELNHTEIDVLKIDIENSEWEFLRTTDWSSLKIGQVLIEIHDNEGRYTLRHLFSNSEGLLRKLEKAGYLQFAIEPVCNWCVGQYELAYIHRHWRPATGMGYNSSTKAN